MNHMNRIAAKLPELGVDAVVITSAPGEFYAIGFHGEGLALVTREGNFYSTDSRYIEAVNNQVTDCEITMISNGASHLEVAAKRCAELGLKKIGFEEQTMSVASYNEMKEKFPEGTEFVGVSETLTALRACKDEDELKAMRKAQEITDRAFTEIQKYLKPGVTESEIAARLTYLMMSFGAERNSFDPIVASGPNGSMPHAIPGPRQIQEGEFVTMDFGCIYGGYCSDMTRTVCVGQPTEEMVHVYETVLKAQLKGISMAKAGVLGRDVHNAAEEVLAEGGYAGKMGHGFGHSLGIEIHEEPRFSPRNDKPIPLGACLSAEPGVYLPGEYGVRIEDVVWVQENGCEVLTKSPKELIIIPVQ